MEENCNFPLLLLIIIITIIKLRTLFIYLNRQGYARAMIEAAEEVVRQRYSLNDSLDFMTEEEEESNAAGTTMMRDKGGASSASESGRNVIDNVEKDQVSLFLHTEEGSAAYNLFTSEGYSHYSSSSLYSSSSQESATQTVDAFSGFQSFLGGIGDSMKQAAARQTTGASVVLLYKTIS